MEDDKQDYGILMSDLPRYQKIKLYATAYILIFTIVVAGGLLLFQAFQDWRNGECGVNRYSGEATCPEE